jgi:hypothetical protein
MDNFSIGKLQRVPLREVWKHEAHNFTQWLEQNIDALNTAIDLNLVNVDREQAAGDFSIDLVAEDDAGATWIVENQLEKSNHDHLGKIITYLTAMSARGAVWIVSDPRPEHVTAIAWLNESSSGAFYMVKVEAVRIGESPAAALFTLIVGPSKEAKSVGLAKKEIAERYGIRKRWWTTLLERSAKVSKLHTHLAPGESSYLGTSSGVPGLYLNYVVGMNDCAAELYIDRGKDADDDNKNIFDQLHAAKDAIEKAFGTTLEWQRLDGKRACRIKYFQEGGGYRSPEEKWPEIQGAIVDAMCRLERALQPYLQKLKTT